MSLRRSLKTGLVLAALAALIGCSEPPVPPEVELAQQQQQDLWRAGASVYAPTDYALYQQNFEARRDDFIRQQGRFSWFRDYAQVQAGYAAMLRQGEDLLRKCDLIKQAEQQAVRERYEKLDLVLRLLRDAAGTLKDGRLGGKRLSIVEVELGEARRLIEAGQWRDAEPALERATAELTEKVRRLKPLFGRYADPGQISRWRELADAVIAETRSGKAVQAIVISKLEKQLVLYREGREVARYQVTFGFNYLSRKLYAGDRATPEGRYRVQHKNPGSRYYKALLLDYPNRDDRSRFVDARRKGTIGDRAGIGGLIEIHGGGLLSLTEGCIALENPAMEELYNRVPTGTPVVIVGSLRKDNLLARMMAGIS